MVQNLKITEDYAYHCCPQILKDSLDNYKIAYNKYKQDKNWGNVEGPYCELQSEINKAEVNDCISKEVAGFLRETYL